VSIYYQDDKVTLYHGDCREITDWLAADVLVTDPPYGVSYNSDWASETLRRSIHGDADTAVRDWVLAAWLAAGHTSAILFGSWKQPRPEGTHTRLVWDTLGALGMGDLAIPWKPSDQEIYVIGREFTGRRTSNVLSFPPVQSTAANGRLHPHEKPVPLMRELIGKTRGRVADPCAGSGSTLIAAVLEGRPAIGVELEESDCERIARRLSEGDLAVRRGYQADALDFGEAS
jgi:DNA modification methylase